MSERYTSSETPVLAGKFTTGASVTITIIKLSDESVVVNAAACDEVGATGFFKYTYTPDTDSEEYLWTMTDGTDEVAGSFVVGPSPWESSSSGTTTNNSYIGSSADLETMIGDDPRSAAIALKAASEASQAWYCQEATRRIDSMVLRGNKYDPDQALEFPRIIDGVVVGDEDQAAVVPDLVKRACLEEAIAIIDRTSSTDKTERRSLQEQGVRSFSLGGGYSETFDASSVGRGDGLESRAAVRYMRRYTGAAVR
jgi:hypothetical protein